MASSLYMKRFALLKLYPTGGWKSGNQVLAEFSCNRITDAITYFKSIYPEVNLDKDGYAKEGDYSFCVAEQFNPISH